jgi:hypothetical protein
MGWAWYVAVAEFISPVIAAALIVAFAICVAIAIIVTFVIVIVKLLGRAQAAMSAQIPPTVSETVVPFRARSHGAD